MELEVVEYDSPHRIAMHGEGDGLQTTEDITVRPTADGSVELVYESSYESDKPTGSTLRASRPTC